ncbi:MAG: hypothetical protein V2I56_17395 [Desulfobacteraceae bacterium]|jgi:hypothetical protein|nr:hypothetical protein [Desulfobacteraceae bacterium]
MQTKQAYEKKVEKKLHIFKSQIEALHFLEYHAEKAFNQKIYFQIRFLKQKQEALGIKFQLFRESEGVVWQEMKKGIDALIQDMIGSIARVHSECIEVVY